MIIGIRGTQNLPGCQEWETGVFQKNSGWKTCSTCWYMVNPVIISVFTFPTVTHSYLKSSSMIWEDPNRFDGMRHRCRRTAYGPCWPTPRPGISWESRRARWFSNGNKGDMRAIGAFLRISTEFFPLFREQKVRKWHFKQRTPWCKKCEDFAAHFVHHPIPSHPVWWSHHGCFAERVRWDVPAWKRRRACFGWLGILPLEKMETSIDHYESQMAPFFHGIMELPQPIFSKWRSVLEYSWCNPSGYHKRYV